MEIERKYLVQNVPEPYLAYPFSQIEQGYLCTDPVVRVRRDGDAYYLTYKGRGLLAREEYNLPLTRDAYEHLAGKADGLLLVKRRYRIPLADAMGDGLSAEEKAALPPLTVELDVFEGCYSGLILAEVEFSSIQQAQDFTPPSWYGQDVTLSGEYQNSRLSKGVSLPQITG